MGSFVCSALASLIANALTEAAKRGVVHLKAREQQEVERLVRAFQKTRSSEGHFEAALAEAFRSLTPLQAHNHFHCLFSDLGFRQALFEWMFAVSKGDRQAAIDELRSLSRCMLGTELGDKAVDMLTRSFEAVVQSNALLSGMLNRAHHERLLEASREIAHKVDLRFQDASEQLSRVLEEVTKLAAASEKNILIPSIAQLREEVGRYTDNVLRDICIELPIIGTIDRIEHGQSLRLALDKQAILLLGEAGTGKTGVMARLAQELRRRGECVLFLSADGIARQFSGSCTVADLSDALGFQRPLPDILGGVADAHGRVWLLVDQLDAVAGEPVGGAFVQLVKRMRGRAGCVVVAACRSYEAEFSADVSTIKLPTLHVAALPPEEVCRCLQVLNVAPTADLVGLCGNLLNLSLLATLAQEAASLADVTVEAQLWRAMREHLGKSSRGSLLWFACDCAISSARAPAGNFPTEAVTKADRLASLGVLTRLASGHYRFRHERVRDYFVAYDSVMRREESLPSLLTRVPAARSKTIIPWMAQIADYEAPHYLDRLFVEGLDQSLVRSAFPRQALIHSLPLILEPTSSLALVIWRICVQRDDERSPNARLCSEIPETPEWAEALWHAKVFHLASQTAPGAKGEEAAEAVLSLLPIVPQAYSEQVLTWIGDMQTSPPSLTGVCSVLLKAPLPHFRNGISKMLSWWEQRDDDISVGKLDQVRLPDGILVRGLFDLAQRLEENGEHQMAVRLVRVATAPFLRSRKWGNSSEERFLTARYRDTFIPPDNDDEECHFARRFRIPPADLVDIFRDHIRSMKDIAQRDASAGYGDPYACWAKVRHLLAPGRNDRGQEWQLWYGALSAAARAALRSDRRAGLEYLRHLLESPDLLEVRIGLHLLAGLRRIPSGLLSLAMERGYFREPAAIGEAILVFDKIRTRKDASLAAPMAAELRVAVQTLDHNRPDHLSLDARLPDRLLRWADAVALDGATDAENEDFAALARFILALGYRYRIRSWSFNRLAKFCEVCSESDIRPTGRTFICDSDHTELFDCTPEWNSLHAAGKHVCLYGLDSRFESLLAEALTGGTQWIAAPIGYAMLLAAQGWFSDSAKSLYEEESEDASWEAKPRRRPSEKRLRASVLDLLRAYHDVPRLEGGTSAALRAQFAGLLGLLVRKLPDHLLREVMPALRPSMRELVSCKETGCVRSWGQVFHSASQPMSTASVALYNLTMLLWRERHGGKATAEVLLRAPQSNPQEAPEQVKALVPEDRQAVVAAIEQVAAGNIEVARVLGFCFAKLLILDPLAAKEALQAVMNRDRNMIHAFADGLGRDNSAWLLYKDLRALYEHVIRDESATISSDLVSHVACAYLLGWEELRSEESLLAHIREACKPDDRADLIEIMCDAFDSLGRDEKAWTRVQALWQLASDEAGSGTTRELGGFWRCLQQGRKTIGDEEAEVKLHVPEPIETLAPLLEKTCAALATDPGYLTDKRMAVARYLGAQSVGHEATAVRLLGLCLGVHAKDYASIVLDYHEEAREVLRNAISIGGEARKLATQIIERHEAESSRSLVGLLM